MGKNVVISCGPIPARLDSVKFITNRFKGGLAFKTASYLMDHEHQVTVIAWKFTEVPDGIRQRAAKVVQVADVFEYCDWFTTHASEYDAFVMAAAVANLTPVNPFEGKFPSHNYKPGEEFNIKFMIAPRAIDIIKKINPRATLIGYKLFDAKTDEELIEIARHTREDAKANIVFANTPKDAKVKKLAVMADNSVVPCSFNEHLELMNQVINAQWFKTLVEAGAPAIMDVPEVKNAMALVSCFEKTFDGFGTVAVPAGDYGFVTTARGHKAGPVLVRWIDFKEKTIYATGRATLNAPTLARFLKPGHIVIHRHFADKTEETVMSAEQGTYTAARYQFPGTMDEADVAMQAAVSNFETLVLPWHGYLALRPLKSVDWEMYHSTFPEKYFSIPKQFQQVLDEFKDAETLEIGGNADATGKYAYDPYVMAADAMNLTWEQVCSKKFDLVFAKNAINYLTAEEISNLLEHTDRFIANTFRVPPDEKVTDNEAAIRHCDHIQHFLRLPDDSVLYHEFFAYDKEFWEKLGLKVTPYGKNSALITKGITL